MVDRLLSIEEIALKFNISTSTVRRWVKSGKLVGQKAGVQWRFEPVAVHEAFQRGILSGASRSSISVSPIVPYPIMLEWARAVLMLWRHFVEDQLKRLQPDHIIVNDRRGAKIWKLLMLYGYIWGKNLWHSTAITLMTPKELQKTFAHQRVLLFDEMMQHGREINELRQCLETKNINAEVTSIVCFRRRSHAESGELLENEALFCEDLDDPQFIERAALISRLTYLFEPPLDPDHLVVNGIFVQGITTEELLERAAKWSVPFIVWFPDEEHEFMGITLDRPQFFSSSNSDLINGFSFSWNGPGKIRIYWNPVNGMCSCSFVIYPDMEAPMSEWVKSETITRRLRKDDITKSNSSLLLLEADEATFHRVYSNVCINLAIKLFNDFITSGAAEEMGIRFDNSWNTIDEDQLRATFGPTIGPEITKRVREILVNAPHGKSLLSQVSKGLLPLFVRGDFVCNTQKYNRNIFKCRTELIKEIPDRYSPNSQQQRPISWSEILYRLPQFMESSIGIVFDDELDRGKVKPVIQIDHLSQDKVSIVKVWRGFCRGEFGPWFEWDRSVFGHEDLVIQRTLGLGPTVVENFLKKTGEQRMIATHFDKTFTNIQHDLRANAHDLFYLGWKPYKYGPIPVAPVFTASGEPMEFQRFLVELECLSERKERHGSQVRRSYEPAVDTKVPWRELYRLRTQAVTRSHLAGLVRLYAAIQKECTTVRPSDPRSSVVSIFQDPLTVLASARNERITYICSWFEVHDWIEKGKLLFALLNGIALIKTRPCKPFLKEHLKNFAAPARLLFAKIEMYRNLPHLRKQIIDLLNQGDFEAGEVLLETIDLNPKFESQSEWPLKNLEWACRVMRAFSSMTRQVLTACGFDLDDRTEIEKVDGNGLSKDTIYYLEELLKNSPELQSLEDDLRTCIKNSLTGILTEDISICLSQTFHLILNVFENQQRIPDPRPQNEKNREHQQARSDLFTIFRSIPMPQPYALAIADIKNLRNLPRVAEIFGTSYGDALDNLLSWVEKVARDVIKHYIKIHLGGPTTDSIILVGHDANEVYLSTLDLINETTRRLGQIDYNQFALFGLLRVGIAWREDGIGNEYQGMRPGLIAYDLANVPGQALGSINVTKKVFDYLSSKHQKIFIESGNDCGQGKVFIRYWNPERDSK